MSLEYLVMPESKKAIKGFWGHIDKTQKHHEEALTGQRWVTSSVNNNNKCNGLKHINNQLTMS